MAFRHVLLKIGLILIAIITFSIAEFTENNDYYGIKPLNYDVKLTFDSNKYVFFGESNITFQTSRKMTNITMPSVIFGIFKIYLISNHNNQLINIQKYSFINKTLIHLDFDSSLSPDTYILKMIYVGTIFDDGNFRESLYKDNELSVTGILTIRARQILPCLNATVKVTYAISVIHQKEYTILSNMPIQKKDKDTNDMMWTHFNESSLMLSQHLMILMINSSTFINILSYTNITFWCRPTMVDHIRFVEDIVQKIAHFLRSKSQFTKIPKIDYVIIWDSQHSNIETIGLILIREEDITYNEIFDHTIRKLEVANFISRKMIAYWYNNVFLWSKEGFITFIGSYVLYKIPIYLPGIMDLFVVQQQQESLRFDTPSITDPNLLTCVNSNISTDYLIGSPLYHLKSPVIWYMLFNLIPQNVFWTSIQKYIDKQIDETINQSNEKMIDNLWNIMQIALTGLKSPLKFDIKNMINTMTTIKQYPIIYVTRDYLKNMTVFSYLSCNYTIDYIKKHPLLVTYTTKSLLEEEFMYKYFWLCRRQKKTLFQKFDEDDWIIVNFAQSEYYRAYYEASNWIKLIRCLNSENDIRIDVLKKAKIIDDAFHFLIHGQFNYSMFWDLVNFLPQNPNYIVWYPIIKAFEYMTCIFPFSNAMEVGDILNKISKLLFDLLKNIGYDEKSTENDLMKYLRTEAIRWACIFNVFGCRTKISSNLHLRHSIQNNTIRWKEWMYCTGLMANSSIWDDVWTEWKKTSNNKFLEHLACCEDFNIISNYLIQVSRYLTDTKEDSLTKVQDAKRANIFLFIVAKHAKNNKIFDFILDNFLEFNLILEEKISTIIVMITHTYDVFQLKKISSYMTKYNLTRLTDAINKKIKKRKMEHEKKVVKYGFLVSSKITSYNKMD